MKKKICFILPKFALEEISGAELQVFYLAKELAAKGFDVHYIREASNNAASLNKIEGITLHTIPKVKHFFFQAINLPFLYACMKDIKADYWYCRVSMSYLAIAKVISSFTKGKIIWACSHDREVSLFTSRTKNKLKKIFENIEHSLFINALKKVNYKLVQTEKQQKLLKDNYNLKSYILQNAHPIPELKVSHKEKRIVWIANMRDFKRPDLYLQLVKKLVAEDIQCNMIGAITGKELINEIKITQQYNSNFKYLGAMAMNEVYEVLNKCKILINTSTEEGFPNTFIQAWMCSVPVITLGVDPSGIIKDYNIGFVTTSIDEMKDAILELLNNESLWIDYSKRAHQFAVENFDIKTYVQKFLNIIGVRD